MQAVASPSSRPVGPSRSSRIARETHGDEDSAASIPGADDPQPTLAASVDGRLLPTAIPEDEGEDDFPVSRRDVHTPANGSVASREPTTTEAPPKLAIERRESAFEGAYDMPSSSRDFAPPVPATPPRRRSVQFARHATTVEHPDSLPQTSYFATDGAEESPTPKDRKGTLYSKLRALAIAPSLSGHGRSQSGYTIGEDPLDEAGPSEPASPAVDRDALGSPRLIRRFKGDSRLTDTDIEESVVEEQRSIPYIIRHRGKRTRRRSDEGPQTAPATPRAPLYARTGLLSPASDDIEAVHRHPSLQRRATMTDIHDERRADASEDDGRDRLAKESPWRPSFWNRGSSQVASESGRRPSNFRRLTTWGAAGSDNVAGSTPISRRRMLEANITMSASRWRSLKAGLKMMGQKRKDEHKFDHAKSAELLAELAAGTPAALILASMFQRDDHGHKRIPVLLEQLKVKLTDSRRLESRSSSDRHQIFRIELEYGSGLTRMKWIVHRSLRDFTNLHVRYKLQGSGEKYKHLHTDPARPKLPRFPRTAFPFLRGVRGLGSDDEDEGDDIVDEEAGASTLEASGNPSDKRPKKSRLPSFFRHARASGPTRSDSIDGAVVGTSAVQPSAVPGPSTPGGRREPYPERQRKKLEQYLQQLIRHLMFRADSSRLCKFLELSALGIRLAAEGSYHGKEGFLVIQSAKGIDFRKAWTKSHVTKRHAPKWFLVRHSYVVCVDSPEETNIYDVFLVDADFTLRCKKGRFADAKQFTSPGKPGEMQRGMKHSAARPQAHMLKLRNSERKLRLLAKNERQLGQFEDSIRFMLNHTVWSKPKRFGSFAPVRTGVFAQWLVDGRDYMWNVSRAISMARDVVYIHDWWLSPELYMRRPAAISRKWRLDRLLQRKAAEGVKIFVMLYRNINSAIPIDSTYTKFSLLDLHHNIFVQRSPNQFRQNTFFWAHHEKLCIVDHTVAFVGGIDLCFGRWDTPQHSVCDDKLTGFEQTDQPKDADHCQLWPGKDYSNPHVQDFYALDKPYEEMYDRTVVPRLPWHDVAMQIVGQPARDLTRHFVQRWNYVLRQRKPTRPTPFLLPPPDFIPSDLEALGLEGTCEVQILRSSSSWSIGTPDKTEHSIMTAYVKMIEQSEHFVYIENQFFISSCEVEGTIIQNLVGDALVNRAIRAAKNDEDWRAIIIIPLMPGFQNTVDSPDGTSVRLIMQCQYRSICRGETSIFRRLQAEGIEPEDYIQFYSLRSWGKIGPNKMLVTEQLYIHAKCMIVDDRIAIIGSANINERSMLGDRDSECAAIVRDTDMLWSTMNGEPYLVGRFPHTLRMRLMREHLGVDVDAVMEEELEHEAESHPTQGDSSRRRSSDIDSHHTTSVDNETEQAIVASRHKLQDELIAKSDQLFSFNHDFEWQQSNNPKVTEDKRVTGNAEHRKDVQGKGFDHMLEEPNRLVDRGRDSVVLGGHREVLVLDIAPEGHGTLTSPSPSLHEQSSERGKGDVSPRSNVPSSMSRSNIHDSGFLKPQQPAAPPLAAAEAGIDADNASAQTNKSTSAPQPPAAPPPPSAAEPVNSLVADMKRPAVDKDCMRDPLSDFFHHDVWHTVAENNTRLFRLVFRCMPDNLVQTWKKYKEYAAYAERFAQAQGAAKSKLRMQQENVGRTGPPGTLSVAEKIATLSPIGEMVGASGIVEKAFEKAVPDKLAGKMSPPPPSPTPPSLHEKRDGSAQVRGQAAEPAINSEDAQRGEKTASQEPAGAHGGREIGKPGADAAVNEKAALAGAASAEQPQQQQQPATKPAGEEGDAEKLQRYSSLSASNIQPAPTAPADQLGKNSNSQRRRKRGGTRSSRRDFTGADELMDKAEAEELMNMVQGHLVLWPYDWLIAEEQGGNWLYSIDQLAPLEIYD